MIQAKQQLSREETIKRLVDAGANFDEIDEAEIERLREIGELIQAIGAKKQEAKKSEAKKSNVKVSIWKKWGAPIVSGWGIWVLALFTLQATSLVTISSGWEYQAWLFLLPTVVILTVVWSYVFIVKKLI